MKILSFLLLPLALVLSLLWLLWIHYFKFTLFFLFCSLIVFKFHLLLGVGVSLAIEWLVFLWFMKCILFDENTSHCDLLGSFGKNLWIRNMKIETDAGNIYVFNLYVSLRESYSNTDFFLVCTFLYSDTIQKFTL